MNREVFNNCRAYGNSDGHSTRTRTEQRGRGDRQLRERAARRTRSESSMDRPPLRPVVLSSASRHVVALSLACCAITSHSSARDERVPNTERRMRRPPAPHAPRRRRQAAPAAAPTARPHCCWAPGCQRGGAPRRAQRAPRIVVARRTTSAVGRVRGRFPPPLRILGRVTSGRGVRFFSARARLRVGATHLPPQRSLSARRRPLRAVVERGAARPNVPSSRWTSLLAS